MRVTASDLMPSSEPMAKRFRKLSVGIAHSTPPPYGEAGLEVVIAARELKSVAGSVEVHVVEDVAVGEAAEAVDHEPVEGVADLAVERAEPVEALAVGGRVRRHGAREGSAEDEAVLGQVGPAPVGREADDEAQPGVN